MNFSSQKPLQLLLCKTVTFRIKSYQYATTNS